jgi:hypothetical protein
MLPPYESPKLCQFRTPQEAKWITPLLETLSQRWDALHTRFAWFAMGDEVTCTPGNQLRECLSPSCPDLLRTPGTPSSTGRDTMYQTWGTPAP